MVIIKKIDDIGRIAIPKDVRRSLRWMGGDEIEIIPKEDGTIVLRAHARDTVQRLHELEADWIGDEEVEQKFMDLIELIENKTE